MIPGGAITARCFPPPWFVEDIGGSFVVKASNDRPLVFIYYWEGVGRRSLAKLLTRNAARRIAAGIAKLPELLAPHRRH
jgi:hypothetical protein